MKLYVLFHYFLYKNVVLYVLLVADCFASLLLAKLINNILSRFHENVDYGYLIEKALLE